MRGRMDDAKSYSAPVELGARMEAGGVGRIIESASASFTEGDYIFGMTGWASHAILNEKAVRKLGSKTTTSNARTRRTGYARFYRMVWLKSVWTT